MRLPDHFRALNTKFSSISRPECLHCADLFSNPTVSPGSLMPKALGVQLLPLSPTAKNHVASDKLLGVTYSSEFGWSNLTFFQDWAHSCPKKKDCAHRLHIAIVQLQHMCSYHYTTIIIVRSCSCQQEYYTFLRVIWSIPHIWILVQWNFLPVRTLGACRRSWNAIHDHSSAFAPEQLQTHTHTHTHTHTIALVRSSKI